MLTMNPAVACTQEKANQCHSLSLAVSYSLGYDKHHSNPTLCWSPVEMLNLWKPCVLPHFYSTFAIFLMRHKCKRYRPVSTDLLAPPYMSMAIPLRYLLRQEFPLFTLHRTYNLHNLDLDCPPLPLPLSNIFSGNSGSLYCKFCPSTHSKPACRLQYVTWTWHRDPASPMPQNVNMTETRNKEKSYQKYLESQCFDQWRKHLELTLSDPPGRVRAYHTGIHWHLHNKHKRSMYKPAPYLTHPSCPYQLELLRIRTQHTIHIIPSHLHYAFKAPRADYQDRVCPHCLDKGTTVLGDEIHIICHCPATKGVLQQFTAKF